MNCMSCMLRMLVPHGTGILIRFGIETCGYVTDNASGL